MLEPPVTRLVRMAHRVNVNRVAQCDMVAVHDLDCG